MAKTLDDAIALFRAGHSPRECEKLTGINFMKIVREAKKRGVEKGDLIQLQSSMAKDKAEFVTLNVTEQDAVTKGVEKQLEGVQFYSTQARKVAQKAVDSLEEIMVPMTARQVMSTLKEGMVVEGLVPFYPTAPSINNTNAQQNNSPAEMLKAIAERLPV